MPAIEMVMCTACGLPQVVAPVCKQCGAALPKGVRDPDPFAGLNEVARSPVPALAEAFFETNVAGRRVRVGEGALTVDGVTLRLAELAPVIASERPFTEALLPFVFFAVLSPLGHNPYFRVLFAVLSAASLVLCFAYRRFVLIAKARTGAAAVRATTLARRGTVDDLRFEEAWVQLRRRLHASGVEVRI